MKSKALPLSLLGLFVAVVGAMTFGVVAGSSRTSSVDIESTQIEPSAIVPCPSVTPTSDEEVATLISLSAEASIAAERDRPDVVLRQVNISGDLQRWNFLFTDNPTGRYMTYVFTPPLSDSTKTKFEVTTLDGSINYDDIAFDIHDLQLGPSTALSAFDQRFPAAVANTLSLVREGCNLFWYVSGALGGGIVTGRLSNTTGAFELPWGAEPEEPPR